MDSTPSRRTFLAALGAPFVGLAGCTGEMPWEEELRGPGGEYRPEGITGSEITQPAIARGELLDDFAEPGVWSAMAGERSGTDERALVGDRALRVTNAEGTRAGVYRSFAEPIDLGARHLSVALAPASPAGATVTVELHAPTAEHSLHATRRLPREFDDWIRLDAGYTARQGEPDHTSVEGIRIWVDGADDDRIEFALDDLRTTPSEGAGGAILVFEGGPESAYDEIVAILEEAGVAGTLAVRPSRIDEPGGLALSRLQSVRDAGWDVASYPLRNDPLPDLTATEQRAVIEADHRTLVDHGFEGGARHFVAPAHRLDPTSLEVVREVHRTGFVFGGAPNAFPPSDPHTISAADGTDSGVVQRLVDLAVEYDQLLVLRFGTLTPDAEDTASTAYLRELVAFLGAREIEVMTPSELLNAVD